LIVDNSNKFSRTWVIRGYVLLAENSVSDESFPSTGVLRLLSMPINDISYQTLLDRSTPLTTQRWLATGFLFCLFALIVIIAQGVSLRWTLLSTRQSIRSTDRDFPW
jgi:hypothetical protein